MQLKTSSKKGVLGYSFLEIDNMYRNRNMLGNIQALVYIIWICSLFALNIQKHFVYIFNNTMLALRYICGTNMENQIFSSNKEKQVTSYTLAPIMSRLQTTKLQRPTINDITVKIVLYSTKKITFRLQVLITTFMSLLETYYRYRIIYTMFQDRVALVHDIFMI